MKVPKLKTIIICSLITLMAAVTWTEFYLSQRNILAFKDNWHLGTIGYLNPNIVTAPALTSPHLLHGYTLKSNFDLGIVRILSDKKILPVSGKMWFRIENDGFVDIILNQTDNSFLTLRLSRSPIYPSGIYTSDSSGKYQSFEGLPMDVGPGHHLISFSRESFTLQGKTYVTKALTLSEGKTGVQLSPGNAEIYFFRVNDEVLNFIPDGPRLSLYARHFLIVLIFSLCLGLIPRMGIIRAALAILGSGSLLFLADLTVGINTPENPQALKEKFSYLDRWWTPAGKTLDEKFQSLHAGDSGHVVFFCKKSGCEKNTLADPLPEKTGHRVLLFGGSQSKYGLISQYEQSIHFRFDETVRAKIPDIETINLSTPGMFQDRMRVYGRKLDYVRPDTIIIESVILDEEREALREFLKEVSKRGIRTILLRTPQNLLKFEDQALSVALPEIQKGLESHKSDLPRNMEWLGLNNLDFIRDVKKEFHLIFLDPNDVILPRQINNSGQIFWDSTHLTIYGQKIFGEWLGEEFLRLN